MDFFFSSHLQSMLSFFEPNSFLLPTLSQSLWCIWRSLTWSKQRLGTKKTSKQSHLLSASLHFWCESFSFSQSPGPPSVPVFSLLPLKLSFWRILVSCLLLQWLFFYSIRVRQRNFQFSACSEKVWPRRWELLSVSINKQFPKNVSN